MTDYYVRRSGNNANSGLSPAAAWATPDFAFGNTSPMNSGDRIIFGGGIYRGPGGGSDFIVVDTINNPTSEVVVLGDVNGALTGDPGPVIFTTIVSEVAYPGVGRILRTNGCDYLTFEKIWFESTDDLCIDVGSDSNHITFRQCLMTSVNWGPTLEVWTQQPTAQDLLIDQCIIFGGTSGIRIVADIAGSSEYDVGITIRNTRIHCYGGSGERGIEFDTRNAGTSRPGQAKILHCKIFHANTAMETTQAEWSTTNPIVVRGCATYSEYGIYSNASGQFNEDYNVLTAFTPRTNVTAGSNSKSGMPSDINAHGMNLGYPELVGLRPRPPFEPREASGLLGFIPASSFTGQQTVDLFNRPRPAGGSSLSIAVGELERHDTGTKEITIVDVGPNSVKLTGPADHDIRVPVQAAATTITIRGRFNSTHGTTTRPQVERLANTEIGVTATTVTMTVAADTWETLTIGPFTPTATGIVTLRLKSRPAAGGGIAYFDTVTVT